MLVLTRKLGEVIRIGTGVTVRVLEVKGNQVRLGLEAPPEVKIFREEIYRAILKENEDAALDGPDQEADRDRKQGDTPFDRNGHREESLHVASLIIGNYHAYDILISARARSSAG